jgi:hypothetical protein
MDVKLGVSHYGKKEIFGLTREEITAGRKFHNEKLQDLYIVSDVISVIKSGITGWAGHVACMEETLCTGFGSNS